MSNKPPLTDNQYRKYCDTLEIEYNYFDIEHITSKVYERLNEEFNNIKKELSKFHRFNNSLTSIDEIKIIKEELIKEINKINNSIDEIQKDIKNNIEDNSKTKELNKKLKLFRSELKSTEDYKNGIDKQLKEYEKKSNECSRACKEIENYIIYFDNQNKEKREEEEKENKLIKEKQELIKNNKVEINILNILHKSFLKGDWSIKNINSYKQLDRNLVVNKEFDNKSIIYQTSNLRVCVNIQTKAIDVYAFLVNRFNNEIYDEYWGSFKHIKFLNNIHYTISNKPRAIKKRLLEIDNTKDSDDKNRRFDIDERKVVEICKYIKVGTKQDNILHFAYTDFFTFIQKTEEYITLENEISTNSYGFFDDDLILTPNNSKLVNELVTEGEEQEELYNYLTLYNKENKEQIEEKYTQEEKKNIISRYSNYLNKSIRARLTAQYSLASVFDYYLKSKKHLKEFSFFALKSHSSGKGKSTIIKINNNLLLRNFKSEGITNSELTGSIKKFVSKSTTPGSIAYDDLKSIENKNYITLLKNTATSVSGILTQYPNNVQTTYYNLRSICASVNRFEIQDQNLVDRFIIIDYDNQEIKENDNIEGVDIDRLEDEMELISLELNKNLEYLFSKVTSYEDLYTERDGGSFKLKASILKLGEYLINEFLNLYGERVEELDLSYYEKLMSKPRDAIINDNDKHEREIKDELRRLTNIKIKNNDGSFIEYDYTDLLTLDIKDDTHIIETIIDNNKKKGVKITNDESKIDIGIWNDCLERFNFKEVKISKLSDLAIYLNNIEINKPIRIGDIKKGVVITFKKEEKEKENKEEEEKIPIEDYDEMNKRGVESE